MVKILALTNFFYESCKIFVRDDLIAISKVNQFAFVLTIDWKKNKLKYQIAAILDQKSKFHLFYIYTISISLTY